MGIRSLARRIGGRAADAVASLSVLGPGQLKEIQERRESYLSKMTDPTDAAAERLTQTDRKSTRLTPVTFSSRMPSSA